jgi:hypothetical protein
MIQKYLHLDQNDIYYLTLPTVLKNLPQLQILKYYTNTEASMN